MNELRRKMSALIDCIPDREVLVDVLIDVVSAALQRVGGRPRKGLPEAMTDAPTTSPNDVKTGFPDAENPIFDPSLSPDLNSALVLIPSGPSKRDQEERELDERGDSPDFLTFWDLYPKKVGKSEARRAFKRRKPPIARVIATLAWQRASLQWQQGYIPNPATWLNQGRWEDEPPTDLRSNGYSEKSVSTVNGITKWMEDVK